jgi:hypothetical protein
MYEKKILKADVYSLPDQSFTYNKILSGDNINIVQKVVTFDKNSGGYSVYLEWEEPAQDIIQNKNGGVI